MTRTIAARAAWAAMGLSAAIALVSPIWAASAPLTLSPARSPAPDAREASRVDRCPTFSS